MQREAVDIRARADQLGRRSSLISSKSLASIDLLSGGRLTVAVGAGFPGRFGQPFYTASDVSQG